MSLPDPENAPMDKVLDEILGPEWRVLARQMDATGSTQEEIVAELRERMYAQMDSLLDTFIAIRPTPEERIRTAEECIRAEGFTLRYVEWCEDSETPGILGYYKGATNWEKKTVKISTKANPTPEEMADVLEHELRHVLDPDWDCGNRDVFGRGGGRKNR